MKTQLLSGDGHTHRVTVERVSGTSGWEIRHEADDRLIASVVYDDWHRVERARRTFTLDALSSGVTHTFRA
jgi:hypothetical protein